MTGFTLIEVLVVLGIMSVLTGILLPVAVNIRSSSRRVKCMQNMREITRALELFAFDNDGRYPESVATIGFGNFWHWEAPTMLTGYMRRAPGLHRAMSGYLGDYVSDASIMFCPCAPSENRYLQDAWDAADSWDNPDTPPVPDALLGTYCFYWNYVGFLGDGRGTFKGPLGPSYGRGRSRLLVTD
ncbi:MAG: type II secretion system protein, partial [Planctomycetota bacterium]